MSCGVNVTLVLTEVAFAAEAVIVTFIEAAKLPIYVSIPVPSPLSTKVQTLPDPPDVEEAVSVGKIPEVQVAVIVEVPS
jgi:hypothetical protein